MRLGTIHNQGALLAVVIYKNHAFALSSDSKNKELIEWLARPDELKTAAEAAICAGNAINYSQSDIQAPIRRPGKILCIGLNYRAHAEETGREPPKTQTWFNKQTSAVNSPYGDVELPIVSDKLDHEAELAVVIGKGGRHISAENAHSAIAGYTIGNDVTVRDWQRATPTMMMGKGFDTHAPFGPWIVTADELPDLQNARVRCLVNGQVMQDGVVSDLVHPIPELIAHLSKAFTLEPGDVIFTGTPAGVGVAADPQRFLKHGDVVRCEIDGIGMIENRIQNEVPQKS